ncbi:MAG TPA: hypothetical protein VMA36_11770 [Candidatus Limnocylindria bacterium]|jgi:hypothetical protein|nr:hypothetical protein [Candidatus Limnocylindria bacterium]
MAETIYTVMLARTSYVVSAGAVHALRAAVANGRPSVRIVPLGSCEHCSQPHTSIEIAVREVRAIVRHDATGSFAALSGADRVVPLRRFATG